MEKIASFTINHLTLEPGIYVSRKDRYGDTVITTFDLRMTSPNREPVMNTAEMHTIEHLGATYLRNHQEYKDRIVYFGPMGCRTLTAPSPALPPENAATTRIRTCPWPDGSQTVF